jgi:hypothetical protein
MDMPLIINFGVVLLQLKRQQMDDWFSQIELFKRVYTFQGGRDKDNMSTSILTRFS